MIRVADDGNSLHIKENHPPDAAAGVSIAADTA